MTTFYARNAPKTKFLRAQLLCGINLLIFIINVFGDRTKKSAKNKDIKKIRRETVERNDVVNSLDQRKEKTLMWMK